jgi:hypothetical protein
VSGPTDDTLPGGVDHVAIGPLPREIVDLVRSLGGGPEDRRVALLPGSGVLIIYRAAGPNRDDQLASIRTELAAVRELLERQPDRAALAARLRRGPA